MVPDDRGQGAERIGGRALRKGGAMYRRLERFEVQYGHYREFFGIQVEMSEMCRERGWATPHHWVPSFGKPNQFVVEYEFATIDDHEVQLEAMESDPEFAKLARWASDFVVPGSATVELLKPATHVA